MSHSFAGASVEASARAVALFTAALAPGTIKNRANQASKFIKFALEKPFDPYRPTPSELVLYIVWCEDFVKSPRGIKNYLSGARSWIAECGFGTHAFDSPLVKRALRGLARSTKHVPSPAPPVTPAHVMYVARVFDHWGPDYLHLKVTLLFLYFTLCRQGNLMSPTWRSVGRHVLALEDVVVSSKRLFLTLRSTKTTAHPVVIPVAEVANPTYCPVRAWKAYLLRHPGGPRAAAIRGRDGLPLTTAEFTRSVRMALSRCPIPLSGEFTPHGLRRGAAQACQAAGVDVKLIMDLGLWTSSAVNNYLTEGRVRVAGTEANLALVGLFGI